VIAWKISECRYSYGTQNLLDPLQFLLFGRDLLLSVGLSDTPCLCCFRDCAVFAAGQNVDGPPRIVALRCQDMSRAVSFVNSVVAGTLQFFYSASFPAFVLLVVDEVLPNVKINLLRNSIHICTRALSFFRWGGSALCQISRVLYLIFQYRW